MVFFPKSIKGYMYLSTIKSPLSWAVISVVTFLLEIHLMVITQKTVKPFIGRFSQLKGHFTSPY